jgi:hypothetical protein
MNLSIRLFISIILLSPLISWGRIKVIDQYECRVEKSTQTEKLGQAAGVITSKYLADRGEFYISYQDDFINQVFSDENVESEHTSVELGHVYSFLVGNTYFTRTLSFAACLFDGKSGYFSGTHNNCGDSVLMVDELAGIDQGGAGISTQTSLLICDKKRN